MASSSDWLQLIRKVFLFSSFTGNQLSTLAKRMTLVSFPKGAVLFNENDTGDSLYIVLSGSVRILKSHTAIKDADKNTLAYLNRGDVLGEMALLAGEPRTNTAVVDSTAELLVLAKRDFDALLEKNPTMAVHLSRILSSRLASIHRSGSPSSQPSKIFALVPAISSEDRVVFTVNLALSLAEQTRRKILLCVVDGNDHLVANSLRLHPATISERAFRDGLLQDTKRFNDSVAVHPSGLEVLELDPQIFSGVINNVIYSLFALIKDLYDFCIFVVPPGNRDNIGVLLNEFDKVVAVAGPQSAPSDLDFVRQLNGNMLAKKPERVWLSIQPGNSPADFPPDLRFDWNYEWGRQFSVRGSPFFTQDDTMGHRWMDRLARRLANLTIGFAMGSGAAFGYSLIGMLRVLEQEGIFPDVISGTSMGALIGSFYAAGTGPDELEAIACSITRRKLFFSLIDPIFPRTGLIRGNRILNFLRGHLKDKNFDELLLPFACVATDIQTGKEIILDRGSVAEAVRASLSLPFFFQPYYLDGRYLVDGGLVNPVPTSITVSQGANIILSANLTSKAGERRVPRVIGWWRRHLPRWLRGPSFLEVMLKTIYIMQYEISQSRSEIAHVVMNIKSHDLLWWDLDRAKEMIKMGEATAQEVIPKIKSLLPFFADSCQIRLTRKGRKPY